MFNIFGNNQQPANNQPAQPTNQPNTVANNQPSVDTKNSPGTEGNGVVPNNTATNANATDTTPNANASTESPLDGFKDLWNNSSNDNATADFKPELIDANKLKEVVSKLDLSNVITPDIQQKIMAGGEEAAQALPQVMNAIAQQSITQSTLVANKMMEQQMTKMMESMMAKLPSMVKEQSLANSLAEQNPLYSNPAVKPVIDAVKVQLTKKYPDATSNELLAKATEYVQGMAKSLSSPNSTNDTTNQNNSVQGDDIDWMALMEKDTL